MEQHKGIGRLHRRSFRLSQKPNPIRHTKLSGAPHGGQRRTVNLSADSTQRFECSPQKAAWPSSLSILWKIGVPNVDFARRPVKTAPKIRTGTHSIPPNTTLPPQGHRRQGRRSGQPRSRSARLRTLEHTPLNPPHSRTWTSPMNKSPNDWASSSPSEDNSSKCKAAMATG